MINNYSKYNILFKGRPLKEKQLQNNNDNDKFKVMKEAFFKTLTERIENETDGLFSPLSVSFKIPNSEKVAKVIVKYDEKDKKLIRLFAGVSYNGIITQSQLIKGTKEEVLDYIKDPENQQLAMDMIKELEKSDDD